MQAAQGGMQTVYEKTLRPRRILSGLLRTDKTERVPRNRLFEHTCENESRKIVFVK